jgi:glucokinase
VNTSGAVLGLDLGGTQIRAAAVMPDGELLDRRSAATPHGSGPGAILDACARLLVDVRDSLPADVAAGLAAIGISSMGPVDPWRGVVVDPPNVPDLRDAPLAAEVERRLGLPAFLDRDTNVAALGEHWMGAARGHDDFLYVTVSTGLGGAIFREGSLLMGPDGCAGELGHVSLMPFDGPICGCGGVGHLEAISSGSGIARSAAAAVAADPSCSPFLAARAAPAAAAGGVRGAGGIGRISGRDVADGEAAGDEICHSLMERARRAFAIACVGWVHAFDPDLIVVGGTLAERQGDRWLDPAREEVARTAFRVPAARVKIVAATLGSDVGLVGARPLVAARTTARTAAGAAG